MSDSIKRYASIVIVIATFIAAFFLPIHHVSTVKVQIPRRRCRPAHRQFIFEIWSVSTIFFSVFKSQKDVAYSSRLMLADLMTQHLGA